MVNSKLAPLKCFVLTNLKDQYPPIEQSIGLVKIDIY